MKQCTTFRVGSRIISTFALLPILILGGATAFAQTQVPNVPPEIQSILAKDPGALSEAESQKIAPYFVTPDHASIGAPADSVNCFDYYHFGSVQVDVSPTLKQTIPGATLAFVGVIKNENPYPVVDGQVYVKIFRKTPSKDSVIKENGYPLVDFFLVKDSINIGATSTQSLAFDWRVPTYAARGEYEAAFFFTSAKRYNLLGLSFTDDVTGNKAQFSVTALEPPHSVTFDKNSVSLNDQKFRFASYPPHFSKDESVVVYATLVNESSAERTVAITWTTSAWDGILKSHEKKSETVEFMLKPKEQRKISHTPPVLDSVVTFVAAEVVDHDSKSIMHIRFVRDGIEETRINFPSIMSYPLKAGEANTLFSCVHSTNLPLVSGNTLTLTLKGEKGNVIERYEYKGSVTGAMTGVKTDFTPKKNYSTFDLTASLARNGMVVDEVTQHYDCKTLDPALCTKDSSLIVKIGLTLVLMLIVLYLAILRHQRKKGHAEPGGGSPPLNALLYLLVFSTFFFGGAERVEAKSVTWASSPLPALQYWYNGALAYTTDTVPLDTAQVNTRGIGGWAAGMNPGSVVSATYQAQLVNNASGALITDGATLPVGTQIRIEQLSYGATDVSWVGTGASSDSPYGRWVSGAGPLAIACHGEDFLGRVFAGGVPTIPVDVYVLLNVNPPATSVVNASGNLSCVGNVCTVSGSGTVTLGLSFAATPGKFYYRYYDYRAFIKASNNPQVPWVAWLGCHANNVPMSDSSGPNYVLTIPSQTINFKLTAIAPNAPPLAPVLSGAGGLIGQSLPFAMSTTDPDGDTIRYGIDWNNDSVIDQWAPGSSYVNSGTSQSASFTWGTSGNKTFKVLAEDVSGNRSPWTPWAVSITDPPAGRWCLTSETARPAAMCTDPPRFGSGSVALPLPCTINAIEYRCEVDNGVTKLYDEWTCSASACGATASASFTSSPSCSIAVGASGCNSAVSWTSNLVTAYLTDSAGGLYTTTGTGAQNYSSPGVYIPYGGGTYNIRSLSSSGPVYATVAGTATCNNGTSWDGGRCVLPSVEVRFTK